MEYETFTEIIRDATAGAVAYKIESLSIQGYEVIQMVIIKGDALLLCKKPIQAKQVK